MPHLSVVIVNFNGGELLCQSLISLAKQTRPADRVIVIDNNSSDNSLNDLPQLPHLELITLSENLGFAKANNLAIEQIKDSDYVVLLNPDAEASPCWLENLLKMAQTHPECAFFASKMIDSKNRDYYDGTGDSYHISGRPKRRHYQCLIDDVNEPAGPVFSPCGGAAMYRTSVFKALGGFDESFFCYIEDVDLGFRMQLQGYSGLYVDSAIVYHVGAAITGRQSDFSVYYGHRNLVWTFVKNMPGILFWLLLPLHLLLNLVTIIIFSLKGQGRIILLAKWDAIRGLAQVWRKRQVIQSQRIADISTIWGVLDKTILPFLRIRKGQNSK